MSAGETTLQFSLEKFNESKESTSVYRGVSNKNRIVTGALILQSRRGTIKSDNRFKNLQEDLLSGNAHIPRLQLWADWMSAWSDSTISLDVL